MNNSAVRTLDILEYIANSKKSLGISEISRELGYPKSSVFDIVKVLHMKNYIEMDNPDLKTFKIGLKAYQIGTVYINNASLFNTAHPILEDLQHKTGETVYLAIEHDGFIVYLDKVESNYPIRSTCNIGSQNLMHLTGLGKAMLAGYPEEKVKKLTIGKFELRTKSTIASYEALTDEIAEIRKQGYSVDNGEDIEIVRCVAAPIRDLTDEVIAAISVSMLDVNFTAEKRDQVSKIITKAALEISNKLGYLKNKLY